MNTTSNGPLAERKTRLRLPAGMACLGAALLGGAAAQAQEVLDWASSKYFQYNIQGASVARDGTGKLVATVFFSVTNPQNGNQPWDIKNAPEFKQPAGMSRLAIDVGWTTSDYQNTGSAGESLLPVPFKTVGGVASGGGAGLAPALPVSVDAVAKSVAVAAHPGWYMVTATLPVQATKTGVIALEGHPAVLQADGVTWLRVPVKSAYRYVPITDSTAVPRREVVDIAKCKRCHDDGVHGGVTIPRLSLHGGNRTEELHVCVICHNPNQTDIGYRTFGTETSVDFKRMVHSIHAGGFRQTPYVVIGFRGSTNDFSDVRFPRELRDCTLCHIDNGVKGTFELPLARSVLGSTVNSMSIPGSYVDVDPGNDLKISPIAATCSGCHDSAEVRRHMIRNGASFSALQADMTSGRVTERCVNCHGPGRDKDVRHVHEIGGD